MKTLAYLFSLLLATGAASAAEPEPPPTIPAAQLLPKEILAGKDYSIDTEVPTDGFMAIFHLHTKFGDYECVGREMLYTRLSELRALEELERVSKTKVFLAAAGGAVEEPAKAAIKIVTTPGRSAAAVPVGIGHLFKDIGEGVVDTGKAVGKLAGGGNKNEPKRPPGREDPIGYNKIRNEWARKLGVDPYTTNRVLAVKLNHLATIGFTTDKAVSAGVSFEIGGLGVIGSYLSYLPDIDEHLLTAPPSDVTAFNAKRLKELGVSKDDMKPLLENSWFSPSLQTRFVNDLAKLRGVEGMGAETRLAGLAQSEEDARFLCGSLELLDRYHANSGVLRELTVHAGLPAAMAQDGSLVIAAATDVLSWTDTVSQFAAPQQGSAHVVFCTGGMLTQNARDGFKSQGWQVLSFPQP